MLILNNLIAVTITALVLFFLFQRRMRRSPTWHATVTPLASIIGSGFLVSAPLLLLATGRWAVIVMLLIVLVAYLIGASLRFNILHVEPILGTAPAKSWVNRIETISRPILGVAYIISVAFYLKLLSAFALRGFGHENLIIENMLSTAILLTIGILGKYKGLSILEFMETYSVNIKLSIIAAILVTFLFHNAELMASGQWVLSIMPQDGGWSGVRKVLGMLIIIQGFETSRYLSEAYSPEKRIQTMRYAQWISGGIYVAFVAVAMIVFEGIHTITETTIINLCHIVAPILPTLLVFAAIMSQFSAAIADTVGSGGLLCEATHGGISVRSSYLAITLIGVALTWLTNIYEIIVIASKAFAIYYGLEVFLTLIVLKQTQHPNRCLKLLAYSALLLLLIAVILFGIPFE